MRKKRPLTESRILSLRFASNIRSCRAARCMEHPNTREDQHAAPAETKILFSPTPSVLRLISGTKPGIRHHQISTACSLTDDPAVVDALSLAVQAEVANYVPSSTGWNVSITSLPNSLRITPTTTSLKVS